MDNTKLMFLGLLVLGALLAAAGQLAFKTGVSAPLNIIYIILGLVVYGISTLLYLFVLGRAHLSWVYSMGGLSYLFTVVLASVVLGESMMTLRLVGVVVIAAGAVLVGHS